MTNKEAIEFIDDRMCWGRGKWSEHHMPEIDEYWQAGLMAIEALKAQDAKDAKSMPSQLPSGDTIYRQAAMSLAKDICVPTKDGSVYRHRCIDPDDILKLSSAEPEQPEIIRCKDCKHRDDDDFCTGRGYPNSLVPDDGFCDKGERSE